jgi:hypothetical protein
MHSVLGIALAVVVAGWAFDRLVDGRIAKRMRPAAAPAPPKPQAGLSLREGLTLVGAVVFLIALMAVAGHFNLG